MSALDAAERLKQDVGQLLDAGRTTAHEYGAAGASFRKLLLSDLALARVALVRGLVLLLVCALMAGTAWVTAMLLLVVGLNMLGAPWLLALLIPLLASVGIAWFAWTAARKALALADLETSRRQFAAWFAPIPREPAPTDGIDPEPTNTGGDRDSATPEQP
jgi:hypothetical protein